MSGPRPVERAILAERIRHDLGKYVVFEVAFCGEDAPPAVLRDALRHDLLETQRGPDGTRSAAALWAGLRAELGPLAAEPAARAVDDAVAAMVERLPALAAEPPDPAGLRALAAAAEEVRRSCYAFADRAPGR